MKRLIFCAYFLLITHCFVTANIIPVDFRCHYNTKPITSFSPASFHKAPHEQSSLRYQQDTRHIDLFKYSCDQLKVYFAYHNYSEKNILDQNMLYLSDEFVKLAKTYPGYELAVSTLRKKMCGMSPFGKWWRKHIAGSYSPQLETRINQLYAEIHHTQQFTAATSQASHCDIHKHAMTYLRDEWMQCAAISYDQKTKERLNKRIHALDQHDTTFCSPPHKDAYIFAQQHHIDLYEFAPNNASALAHVLYQEYVDILDTAAHIPVQNTEILCDALGQASHIGLEANKAGFVDQASKLADFCWTVLDYAQAAGEGIYLGTTNTLHTLAHPIETVTNTLIGIGVITYGLVNLTDFVQHAPFLYIIDNDQFFLRFNTIQDQLQTIANAAITYLTSNEPRIIVKDGTAFVTEGLLLGKIISFAANLTKQILPLAMYYAEYIAAEEPLACFADGEMIPVRISKGIDIGSFESGILKMKSNQLPIRIENGLLPVAHTFEEIITAIAKIEDNRIHHILTPKTGKHAWNRIITGEITWEKVKLIIEKVMLEGAIEMQDFHLEKHLNIGREKVVVTFKHKLDGALTIGNAWVETICKNRF